MEIPEDLILGISRKQLTSTEYATIAIKKLSDIIVNKGDSLTNRKLACIYFSRLVGETTEEVRSKFIVSLEVLMTEQEFIDRYNFFFSSEERKFDSFITQELHEFYFKNFSEPLIYRILSAGYLLEYKKISNEFRISIEGYLISLSKNAELCSSIRAECADILKRVGKDEIIRAFGDNVISELSGVKIRGFDTIYMNNQNAHSKDIIESATLTLQQIATTECKTNSLTTIRDELISLIDRNAIIKFDDVLNRMFIDSSRFDGYTLPKILYMVWDKIFDNTELKKRLIEELLSTEETCSSGFFVRMMNVFTGTKYSGIKISFENEICSATIARLNTCLEKLGEETKDQILTDDTNEMVHEFIDRYSPKDELWQEYKNLLKREEFERLYKKAEDLYSLTAL